MMKKTTAKKLALRLLYVLYLLLVFEGCSRILFSIPKVSQRLWIGDDLSWRRAWVSRHKRTNNTIFYGFDIHDPLTGWRVEPGIRDKDVFDGKILNTNSRGIRGRREYSYRRDTGGIRILVIGDSFTFGDGVSDDETYSAYLQDMIPGSEVINLGVHGYGHDQILLLFQEEGLKYQPDILILGFLPMDMSRNVLGFRDFAKPKYVLERNSLHLKGVPVPEPAEVLAQDWMRPRIVDLGALLVNGIDYLSGHREMRMKEVTTAILKEIITLAENSGIRPLFVYLPEGTEIHAPALRTQGEQYLFSAFHQEAGVECISLRPYFKRKREEGVSFVEYGHWGPSGHFAAAEAIYAFLLDAGYIPPPGPPA